MSDHIMNDKTEIQIQDTLSKLPKWLRTQPDMDNALRKVTQSDGDTTEFIAGKATKSGVKPYRVEVSSGVAPFGERMMREIVVKIRPADGEIEVSTFSEA